ncbi:MAG: phosphate ABC transporter ATP-binding protein, partial [Actinobacteria bacterium]|nr:phosphate ABC transporter ATP-binding protein [Actinomycetota bacterium]
MSRGMDDNSTDHNNNSMQANQKDSEENMNQSKTGTPGVARERTQVSQHSLSDVARSRSISKGVTNNLGSGLEAKSVHAWFGSKHVLEDISMTFDTGTVTALIGPSGC